MKEQNTEHHLNEIPRNSNTPKIAVSMQSAMIGRSQGIGRHSAHRLRIGTRSLFVDPLVGLTASQKDLYRAAYAFGQQHFKPHAAEWDETSSFPRELMRECAKRGYGGMLVPKAQGGPGWLRADCVCIIDALAQHCISTTAMLTIHNACTGIVAKSAKSPHREAWTPALVSMDLMASFCLTEPGSGSDAASIVSNASFDADSQEYVLNGQKCFISGAGMSDIYLVMCRTSQERISCLAVTKDSKGLSFGMNEKKMGWRSQPTRQVFFDNVRVPVSQRIGDEGQGFRIAMAGLDGGRLSIAACSIGGAQACLDMALAHCRQHEADQMTLFRLVDMAGKIMQSRQLLRAAAAMLDAQHPAAIQHCAFAKMISTRLGSEVCADAMQLLGPTSLLKDTGMEKIMRDLRVHEILEGTNEIMHHLLGRSIVS